MKRIISTLALLIGTAPGAWAAPQYFDTPEAAVTALVTALEAKDKAAVLQIFGPEAEDVVSTGDAEEDRVVWREFLDDMHAIHRLEPAGDGRMTLLAGREMWPFPADLVKGDTGWSFDAESAREEVLARRIGRNELEVIGLLRRAHEVQASFRQTDYDGDGVMEFAASILSTPGQHDGLFWAEDPDSPPSPFDESLARANFTGFSSDGEDREPEPYEGYYFRILQGQGPAAPGGAYSYMVNGNMVSGHAIVAYPAAYGDSGIMSFIVAEPGIVYQTDLGEDTLEKAAKIELFDPTEEWAPVE
ncbi:DUF2950 domain-containing protein [Paracoccus litorisediminis]|uniref:DUF2950 family protein n=1 Tax=Paracoccus litorisediminis TaxID=2006130 RepID=A0A844HRE6_9RHOB|nr:DUF2950 domain-containing protein [Paracoccus litorisediminis]MTH61729.1 DUF2950 family protein [Paracoccus litorisediminis]